MHESRDGDADATGADMETLGSSVGECVDVSGDLHRCVQGHTSGPLQVRLRTQKNEAACVGLLLECACES